MLNTRRKAAVLLVCMAGLTAAYYERRRQVALDAATLAADAGGSEAHQLKEVKAIFEKITGQRAPSHLTGFLSKWRLRKSTPTGLASLQKGGRQPVLPPELVDTIAREWTQAGTGRGAYWQPYNSIEEVRAGAGAPRQLAPATPPAVPLAAALHFNAQVRPLGCRPRTCRQ